MLSRFDFDSKIIPREKSLKKIAVKQVNAALNHLLKDSDGSKH
jgi:hypothetical protein